MKETPRLSLEQARVMAEAAQLDLPPDRLESLATMLSDFLIGFEEVRAVDPGDREPATITWSKES